MADTAPASPDLILVGNTNIPSFILVNNMTQRRARRAAVSVLGTASSQKRTPVNPGASRSGGVSNRQNPVQLMQDKRFPRQKPPFVLDWHGLCVDVGMRTFWDESNKAPEEAGSVDRKLVIRCLAGDQDAWETIVRSHARRIFGLSYRYTGSREEAEDLTQEIFIRIYQTLWSFRSESGSFVHWALKVSRNLIIDRYRQSRRFHQSGGSPEIESMNLADEAHPSADRTVEQAESSRILRKALCTLSPETKEAIILRDLEGMGYKEMSEVLGVPEGTIKSRISRGRLALARTLSRNQAFAAVGR